MVDAPRPYAVTISKALPVAYRGGAVMGFSVAGLALGGLMLTYLVFVEWFEVGDAFEIVTAFGLGASSIALFPRVRCWP